jgi:predicted DNA-binding protein YlxM (UPF0122 family)
MDRTLGDRFRVIMLFDAYGGLLTERRRTLLQLYYLRDLSLGEIAQELRITRQAVYDSLHRSVNELERLEDSLHALEQKRVVVERTAALERTIKGLAGKVDRETLDRVLEHVTALRRTLS